MIDRVMGYFSTLLISFVFTSFVLFFLKALGFLSFMPWFMVVSPLVLGGVCLVIGSVAVAFLSNRNAEVRSWVRDNLM